MTFFAETTEARKKQLREFAEQGKTQLFETLWSELLDQHPEAVDAFMGGIAGLESIGNFEKAGQLLSALVARLQDQGLFAESLVALRKMSEIAPRERIIKHGLLTAFRSIYKDDPRLPIYLAQSKLETDVDLKTALQKIDTYFSFEAGRYVNHGAGWGPGKIVEVDAEATAIVVDFGTKKGHRLSMEMARGITEFLQSNDLRAMKLDRIEELKRLAEDDPVELVRATLRSRRNKATLREIK
ncbi:MAG TPA: hypothetical protein VIZ69_02865, partial [Thermoanaerobaculia bacterium]